MYLYFGLNVEDLEEFCQLTDKKENKTHFVNDKVFINIRDGVFIKTFIAKLHSYYAAEGLAIIGFDDRFQSLRSLSLISLISFIDLNKEIRVKLFDVASNVNTRDNFKYTVRNGSTKSEDNTNSNNKQTYYFTLTKEDYNRFVYVRYDGTKSILTAIWNDDHTNFTLENVPVVQVMTVSISSDLLMFRISDFDSRNFHISRNSHNAYEKQIYFYEIRYPKTVEFFTDLDDCIHFTKTKKEEPRITNKLEEQWSWDCKPLNMSKKETKMAIKDIKKNGPATIIFWLDGDKTVVKCQPGDRDDIEKGVIMALVKGIFQKYKGTNNWTEAFKIPYSDEIDVEKVIGLALLRDHYGNFMKNPEWHYDYVLRWVYKIKGYKIEDEIAALKALGYSDERIKKCLNTTKGKIREALGQDLVYKKEQKIPAVAKSNDEFIDHIKLPSGDEYKFTVNKEETKKVLKDIIQEDSLSEKVIKMFNDGTKIAKIAKSLGISEYFVKKALDEATKPKANPRKAERILKKATKEKKTHKTHVMHTEIEFPNYLEKEECEKILEETKVKYADRSKINCMSELQKYFDRECKHYKIEQLYGNGYSMYEIGRIIGVNAAAVQRMHNSDERKQ